MLMSERKSNKKLKLCSALFLVRTVVQISLVNLQFQSNYAGPIDDLDPDSNVLKLNKDLSGMEEMMTQSLQPKKFKYACLSILFYKMLLSFYLFFLHKLWNEILLFPCRYIFESLGYLVASILINSVQFLNKINENGIKKM